MYRNKIAGSESASNSIILSLENTLLEKSHETKDHAERMNELVIRFAEELKLSTSQIDNLKLLSRLHDIGKVSIPEKILKKPDRDQTDYLSTFRFQRELPLEIQQTYMTSDLSLHRNYL